MESNHSPPKSHKIAFSVMVYPALILAYAGQAAYLIKNPDALSTAFYSSVLQPVFWLMFVVATLAAIVASQALISASFSIIQQSMALGCFPRVSMIHTSKDHEGQVYSPEINYFLMIVCILLTVGFKGGADLGNAFDYRCRCGSDMGDAYRNIRDGCSDACHLGHQHYPRIHLLSRTYMTSLLTKLSSGGWVPFAISASFFIITLSWTYGRCKRSEYEAENKMGREEFNQLVTSYSNSRVPGICFFCTDLINGIPPIIRRYVNHVGTLREVMVLVMVRTLPVRTVLPEERFLVGKLGTEGMYRCLVQYGYMDKFIMEGEEFVSSAIDAIKEIVEDQEEIRKLETAFHDGVIFVMGRIILKVGENQGCFRQLIINTLYRFLQKNFRTNVDTLKIPPSKILQVGMLYKI